MLSRDELARDFAMALAKGYGFNADVASRGVVLADALLAALAPVVPPVFDASGNVNPVYRPAPVEAAPGKYVPMVGDVVRIGDLPYQYECVLADFTNGREIRKAWVLKGGYKESAPHFDGWSGHWPDLTYLRPATPAERAAAGLPVEAVPSVPEVGSVGVSSRSAAQSGITGVNPPGAIRDDAGAQPLGANAGSWPGDATPTPAPVAKRPEWVRFPMLSPKCGVANPYTSRRVVRWNGECPIVARDDGTEFEHATDDWEPCAPPAPVEPAKGEDVLAGCVHALERTALFLESAVVTDGAVNVRGIAGVGSVLSIIGKAIAVAKGGAS